MIYSKSLIYNGPVKCFYLPRRVYYKNILGIKKKLKIHYVRNYWNKESKLYIYVNGNFVGLEPDFFIH